MLFPGETTVVLREWEQQAALPLLTTPHTQPYTFLLCATHQASMYFTFQFDHHRPRSVVTLE